MSGGSLTAFREQFAAYAANGGGSGPEWLPALRRRAFERFSALGYPTTKNEDFHYTSVAPIAETTFGVERGALAPAGDAASLAAYLVDPSWHRLVFVNGVLSPALSAFNELPAEVEVSSLPQAVEGNAAFVESALGSVARIDDNAFAALNTAFIADGVVVRVPENVVVDAPLHIVWVVDGAGSRSAVFPRLLVEAAAHSRVAIVESFVSTGGSGYFTNAVAEVRVGAGAHVEHYKLQRESSDAFHVSTLQAVQARDSVFHSLSFAMGARLSRTNVYTKLAEPGGEARLNGLYLVSGEQHCDHQTYVHHAAERCASRELYKGILDDSSRGVFNGKVLVDPVAQQTDGKQTNHALLLSEQAKVDTKPQLEIFADDVKCTHGATVGRLDDLMSFYLRSRGIGRERARALLVYAFAAEVLDTVEVPALREALMGIAFERYNQPSAR